MNNQFMFMPNLNPYADNAKFIKKTVRPRHAAVMAFGIAVMLTSLMYGVIYSFSMSNGESAFYESSDDMTLQAVRFGAFGLKLLFMIVGLALPCIGIVNLMVNFKDKESPYLPNSFAVLVRIFFILFLLYSVGSFLGSFGEMAISLLASETEDIDDIAESLANILMMNTIPPVVWIIWAISGLVFTSSVKKTLKCQTLVAKGASFFQVQSVIMVITNVLLAIGYNANEFEGGIFYSSHETSVLTDAISENQTAIAMFNIYFIACAVVIIAAANFALDYNRAVKAAIHSFNVGGSNMYMNGDSTNAAYFQNFYNDTNPQANNEPYAPPQPANQQNTQAYVPTSEPSAETYQPQQIQTPSSIVCNTCGAENPPDCKFCIQCGSSLNI